MEQRFGHHVQALGRLLCQCLLSSGTKVRPPVMVCMRWHELLNFFICKVGIRNTHLSRIESTERVPEKQEFRTHQGSSQIGRGKVAHSKNGQLAT